MGSTKNKDSKRAPPARMASISMHTAPIIKNKQPLVTDSMGKSSPRLQLFFLFYVPASADKTENMQALSVPISR